MNNANINKFDFAFRKALNTVFLTYQKESSMIPKLLALFLAINNTSHDNSKKKKLLTFF